MSLSKEDIKTVVAYRKVKSYATLWEAEDMIATEHWNLAVQRMYYAFFYMLPPCCLAEDLRCRPIMV